MPPSSGDLGAGGNRLGGERVGGGVGGYRGVCGVGGDSTLGLMEGMRCLGLRGSRFVASNFGWNVSKLWSVSRGSCRWLLLSCMSELSLSSNTTRIAHSTCCVAPCPSRWVPHMSVVVVVVSVVVELVEIAVVGVELVIVVVLVAIVVVGVVLVIVVLVEMVIVGVQAMMLLVLVGIAEVGVVVVVVDEVLLATARDLRVDLNLLRLNRISLATFAFLSVSARALLS